MRGGEVQALVRLIRQSQRFVSLSPHHGGHLLSNHTTQFQCTQTLLEVSRLGYMCRSSMLCSAAGGKEQSTKGGQMEEIPNNVNELQPSSETTMRNDVNNEELSSKSSAEKDAYKRVNRGSPVSWLSLGLLLATGAGITYFYDREKKRRLEAVKEDRTEAKEGPSVGKAAIGGPFKLWSHQGKEVTEKDFEGKWVLIYFGFTYCPDICPDELQKMVEAIEKIESRDGIQITPIFITVDPERDNVEQMREYVREFHPRLVGLTGSAADIRQVAREFRVYYMKTDEEGSDYLVDHSIIMYLMDPKTQFVKFFGKNFDANGLADGKVKAIDGPEDAVKCFGKFGCQWVGGRNHKGDIKRYLMDPKMQFVKFFGKNFDANGLADGIIKEIKKAKA